MVFWRASKNFKRCALGRLAWAHVRLTSHTLERRERRRWVGWILGVKEVEFEAGIEVSSWRSAGTDSQ